MVKLGIGTTFSNLGITSINDKSTLQLKTVGRTNIIVGVDYKWFGLGIGIGLPPNQQEVAKKGNTIKLDFQLNIFTKKIGGDVYLQQYKGYYFSNPKDFVNWSTDTFPQLPTMEQYAFGASGFYVFNNKKFSNKAPYSRKAIQLKSAGSILAGVFINLDAAASDISFVPDDSLLISIRDSYPIYAYSSITYGLSVGYSYTWVISPKFFFNATLISGFGVKNVTINTYSIDTTSNTPLNLRTNNSKSGITARIMYKTTLGFENYSFLFGIAFYGSQGTIEIEDFQFKPGLGTFKMFAAKRFGLKQKKKFSNPEGL